MRGGAGEQRVDRVHDLVAAAAGRRVDVPHTAIASPLEINALGEHA